jgi:hypothetical protein
LRGTGTATVVTPAFYAPGSVARVTIGGVTSRVVADGAGRLHLSVPLGLVAAPAVMGVPVESGGVATVFIR